MGMTYEDFIKESYGGHREYESLVDPLTGCFYRLGLDPDWLFEQRSNDKLIDLAGLAGSRGVISVKDYVHPGYLACFLRTFDMRLGSGKSPRVAVGKGELAILVASPNARPTKAAGADQEWFGVPLDIKTPNPEAVLGGITGQEIIAEEKRLMEKFGLAWHPGMKKWQTFAPWTGSEAGKEHTLAEFSRLGEERARAYIDEIGHAYTAKCVPPFWGAETTNRCFRRGMFDYSAFIRELLKAGQPPHTIGAFSKTGEQFLFIKPDEWASLIDDDVIIPRSPGADAGNGKNAGPDGNYMHRAKARASWYWMVRDFDTR